MYGQTSSSHGAVHLSGNTYSALRDVRTGRQGAPADGTRPDRHYLSTETLLCACDTIVALATQSVIWIVCLLRMSVWYFCTTYYAVVFNLFYNSTLQQSRHQILQNVIL